MTALCTTRLFFIPVLMLVLVYSGNGWCESITSNLNSFQWGKRQPSEFLLLARYVTGRDDTMQREFSILTLSAMIDSYSRALYESSHSKPRTQAARKKQVSWGLATSRMTASLNHHLRRLEAGAPFILYVDHMDQVLIVVEGRTVLSAGSHIASQSYFERQVVEFFCLTNDCSWLEHEFEEPEEEVSLKRSLSKGMWLFQQGVGPKYEIGGLIRFEFSDFTNREKKAETCQIIKDEIIQVIIALQEIRKENLSIMWPSVSRSQPSPENPHFELLPGDSRFNLKLMSLSKLHSADWERLINWLRNEGLETGVKLQIKYLEYIE